MTSVLFSRRQVGMLAAGGVAVLTSARAASAQDATPSPTAINGIQPDGTWAFTDDLGVTVSLPKAPTKIAADVNAAAPLWDFGIKVISVSGWTVETDASWGNVDRATPVINATVGEPEPDIETLISMDAEVFVTIAWAENDIWSFTTLENYRSTNAVVPVIAISVATKADENMARFIELARAFGADLETPEIIAAKDAFEASVTEFTKVATAKSDVSSLFGSIGVNDAGWYAAYAPDWADLSWY